jgi:hypothetical protein
MVRPPESLFARPNEMGRTYTKRLGYQRGACGDVSIAFKNSFMGHRPCGGGVQSQGLGCGPGPPNSGEFEYCAQLCARTACVLSKDSDVLCAVPPLSSYSARTGREPH